MRRLGKQKTKTKVAGHQHCGICHPKTKGGRATEKVRWSKEADRE